MRHCFRPGGTWARAASKSGIVRLGRTRGGPGGEHPSLPPKRLWQTSRGLFAVINAIGGNAQARDRHGSDGRFASCAVCHHSWPNLRSWAPLMPECALFSTKASRRSPLHFEWGKGVSRGKRGDARRRLLRQDEVQMMEQKCLLGIRFGVARHD